MPLAYLFTYKYQIGFAMNIEVVQPPWDTENKDTHYLQWYRSIYRPYTNIIYAQTHTHARTYANTYKPTDNKQTRDKDGKRVSKLFAYLYVCLNKNNIRNKLMCINSFELLNKWFLLRFTQIPNTNRRSRCRRPTTVTMREHISFG